VTEAVLAKGRAVYAVQVDMGEELQPATKGVLKAGLAELEARLVEHMRHIETSLLTAFHSYAQGVNVRFRKIEADLSNLDTATLARLDAIEQRMLAIEMRLPASGQQ